MTSALHFLVVANVTRTNLNSWRAQRHGDPLPGSLDFLVQEAQALESAAIDGVFLTDTLFFGDRGTWPYRVTDDFDPFTLAAALAMATNRIGLVVTGSTTFEAPYTLARQVLSLDHVSAGRAGWNIVTTWAAEAADNFRADGLPEHDERYRQAQEAVDVIRALWDSLEDDAVVADHARGVFTDPAKIHVADHHGTYYDVRGPLGARRSRQGRPVLFQAGSSGAGVAFAARNAEVVFTMQGDASAGAAFRDRVRSEAHAAGRTSAPLVTPQLSFVLGSTDEEAERTDEYIGGLFVPELQIAKLQEVDIDLEGLHPDAPMPALPESTQKNQSALQRYRQIAQTPGMTVGAFLARTASGFGTRVVGTPERLADLIEEWHSVGAADGFVLAPNLPGQAAVFAQEVLPILRERGLFRHDYEGETLREHFGLEYPEHPAAGR
ncbi:MAG: NtaA/DmoA family FMN-dependent monooxygenase [Leifsonia sp.]|uniref:NtaA/DmoA family FMN-dependent monooxygenase n=1 Tax=Leifsonia sp. TaxID=1870902 RepID=UPI003F7F2AD5